METPATAEPVSGKIELSTYDPAWPSMFAAEADRIRAALGPAAFALDHVGSTAVPGLAAKPVIDIVLAVADSREEAGYVPALEAAGYALRIREPEWFEHRLFKRAKPTVNLHVFSVGCPEIERMRCFRDWLCTHTEDRDLYQTTKRELADQPWAYVQAYADAKNEVVAVIMARADASSR